jgi:hypothetical protein
MATPIGLESDLICVPTKKQQGGQHYPDSPNHPNFPSTELAPGQVFHEVTEFRFSVAR